MPSAAHPPNDVVIWVASSQAFAADPIATLALARSDWEALGARFFALEDDIGGVSNLAIAQTAVPHGTGVRFAVLDHNEPTTFLLADPHVVEEVLIALFTLGIGPAAILERLPALPPRSVDERLADLERVQADLVQASSRQTSKRT
jgi:hypothetical protein